MNDKRNRTWVEIDLDHVVHNYLQAKQKAGNKRVMCVIKADAYGHGAVPVASALCEAGADYFAVATPEEALQLRRHYIDRDILLLGTPTPSAITELNVNDITLTVSNEMVAKAYAQILQQNHCKQKIHIKIDSGMSRQGIQADAAVEQILRIHALSCFEIEGLYTHLAAADGINEKVFTEEQYKKTFQIVQTLENYGLPIPLFHISNSAGIIAHSYMNADMVRPGIMLYGSNPCRDVPIDLRPAMSLHTRVSNILNVKKGETVGYGRTWTAKKDSVIGVLNIGYADGLMRSLSGILPVLINDQCVKQVGRICMDMCMIDITDVSGAAIGDVATIIGRQGDNEITADEVADLCDTISYEVFCAVGKRVPRIYMQGNNECFGECYIDLI